MEQGMDRKQPTKRFAPPRFIPPSIRRLKFLTLFYHARSNWAVALGVAVGVAVLTGALLVGDSMRGSLRHLALDRLGRVESVMTADHWFDAKLADTWNQSSEYVSEFDPAVPGILLRVSLENPDPKSLVRANHVELIGCDERFWQLGSGGPKQSPGAHEIVLNRPLAEQLGVHVGDAVLVRLPHLGAIPGDSALGDKQNTIKTQRLTVSEIIAAEGLGRLGLLPTQHVAKNAYVSLRWLAQQLGKPDSANVIFMPVSKDNHADATEAISSWVSLPRPALDDYGLAVDDASRRGYVNITTDRMMLSNGAESEIMEALTEGKDVKPVDSTIQPALTYLANTIAVGDRTIPYSTVTGIDFTAEPPLGPFVSSEGVSLPALGPDEVALNTWAADQLHASIGDTVRLVYFDPESVEGQVREKTVTLRLAAIVKLEGAADDRLLTPVVQGITDELTMAQWNPPFPFDAKRITPVDEEYWKQHGPTPKAFVSLATGRRLWASRFGQTTSIRVSVVPPKESSTVWDLSSAKKYVQQALQDGVDPTTMGFVVLPIRAHALAAATGATPFGVLFLSLSFFVIASAVMLVVLLFRLGIDRRASEIGTLMAIGWSRRQIAELLQGEAWLVAGLGSLVGVPLGIGYAGLMLIGLRTWWLAAVVTPFLRLYITPMSLLLGVFLGLTLAMAAIAFSLRRLGRLSVRRLLAGESVAENPISNRQLSRPRFDFSRFYPTSFFKTSFLNAFLNMPRWLREVVLLLLAVVPTIVLLMVHIPQNIQAGAFFGVGAISLLALLMWVRLRLKSGATGSAVALGHGNLARMALRNAARNPGRSTLTMGLVASASFLIVAISAFQVDPNQQTPSLDSGNGGFSLVGESDQPIFADLNSSEGRNSLGFSADDEKTLAGNKILSVRVRPGDDASCLNLYQARQPRWLGLPNAFLERGGFAWADKPSGCSNPWLLLNQDLGQDADGVARVPVVLEKNTANYALHLWGGLGSTFDWTDAQGQRVRFQIVALLADSIFQGDLLVSEKVLLRQYPEINGYRFFLVESPHHDSVDDVSHVLEHNLGDYGFVAETTGRRLAAFLAVQNTYLSTFQSLGGLGLLLGTFGLAVVQLRNVLERRGELALLQAAGFSRRMLAKLVLLENAVLLGLGLLIGLFAAVLAVLPQMLGRGTPLPWVSLVILLALIFCTGMTAGVVAVRAASQMPILEALRRDS
jgi:ABC-type antimicrobial peptide transport system permease subunit